MTKHDLDSGNEQAGPRIFWSWQSDYSESTCRHFIREALVEAIAQIALSSIADADRPELDHDTKDERGMVDIAAIILNKIAGAAIFVADLTPIGQAAGKWVPNPNVLIELGWAMHRPGWERVIGVLNTSGGAKIEDLPFDIRQRRVITYELSETDDKEARKTARTTLVKLLKGAITTNLDARAEMIASTADIKRVTANPSNPSVWASAGATISHHDGFGGALRRRFILPDVPRSYMRITPAGWKSRPPSVSDVARPPDGLTVEAPSDGASTGDFGATEEGFVRYWITGTSDDGTPLSSNVVMYFEDIGEFWMLDGSSIVKRDKQFLLRDQAMLGWWSRTLRNAIAFMGRLGSRETYMVEAGLHNVSELQWYSDWASERRLSRRNQVREIRQSGDWSPSAQVTFLSDAYNAVRGLFAFNRLSEAEITEILMRFDSQRFAEQRNTIKK